MTPVLRTARRTPWPALAAAGAVVLAMVVGPSLSAAAAPQPAARSVAVAVGPAVVVTSGTLPAGWRHEMLARVNAARGVAGVAPLHACASLRRAAQGYAESMATTDTFGHVGAGGTEPWDRMRAQGFAWQVAAENIAMGQASVAQVVNEWLASPTHAEILLDARVDVVGFGFAVSPGAGGRSYWVQDFGRGSGC